MTMILILLVGLVLIAVGGGLFGYAWRLPKKTHSA